MLSVRPTLHTGSHAPRPKKYKDTLHDEAWLRARYVDERLSSTAIGELIGAPRATVKWALDKFDIEVRSGSEARAVLYETKPRTTVTKAEFVAAYGGRCACCGETELVFLSLDHINGGGNQHRMSFSGNGGRKLLQEATAAGWPDIYRVLCMNCQFGTRYGKVCPHRADDDRCDDYAPATCEELEQRFHGR